MKINITCNEVNEEQKKDICQPGINALRIEFWKFIQVIYKKEEGLREDTYLLSCVFRLAETYRNFVNEIFAL